MRKSSLELFKEHYSKHSNRIRWFNPEEIKGTSLVQLSDHPQLAGIEFTVEIIPESLDGYFRGMFSYRYAMGIEFRLVLSFPRYFGEDVRVDCGIWRAWDWDFFIPRTSPEGKIIADEEELESEDAMAADIAD